MSIVVNRLDLVSKNGNFVGYERGTNLYGSSVGPLARNVLFRHAQQSVRAIGHKCVLKSIGTRQGSPSCGGT